MNTPDYPKGDCEELYQAAKAVSDQFRKADRVWLGTNEANRPGFIGKMNRLWRAVHAVPAEELDS